MARPRAKLDTHNQAEEVTLRHKIEKVGWKRERLGVVRKALEGATIYGLAEEFGRSHQTIQDWVNKYRVGGIEELLTKRKGNGPKSRLKPEVKEALEKELEDGKHRTAKQVWAWLDQNFDMSDYKPSSIYNILGKCGGRLKVPRPYNPKKDPVKEQEFRDTLAEKMEALCLPPNRPVRLWVYDEMRYGLHPLTRKVWCKRGVRAVTSSRRRYKNCYVYGALQVGGSGAEFLMTTNVDKDWDRIFIEQIVKRDPYASHVIIGDGAGFHHNGSEEELPDNAFILRLPAYCPELNPIEKLWDIVKDGICNREWKNMEELESKLMDNLQPYWEIPTRVFSLFRNSYLCSELNAT